MAINQEAASRTITLPVQQVSAGTGLTQLASATSQVGQLITERLNEVAISKAATQGETDAEAGIAPKNLIAPFTKATKAYNEAVSRTEANRMAISAEQLINQSLIESKNPATFNSSTPEKFNASLEGIRSGILQNARPENRAILTQHIDRMTNQASLNMLSHSIEFDNKQAQLNLKQDVDGLLEARRNAAIAGDANRVSGIDDALNSTVNDYSAMNAAISRASPLMRQEIEKSRAVDNVLGGFSQAIETKTTAEFMRDLATNQERLPFNIWQDSVKAVVSLDQEHKRLINDISAQEVQQVNNAIDNGTLNDPDDILNMPNMTATQQLQAMHKLDVTQAKQMALGAKVVQAQQNILSGRPTWNSGSDRDNMFESAIQTQEQQTGQPANLAEMSQSILGKGNFPASGMLGMPMGTNVPAFDSVMAGQLTNKDPIQTAQAAMVFNDMVKTQDQPNSVNLTGEPLAVATLFNTLNKGGTTPEQAATLAINTVLNAKEPEIITRSDRFHRTFEKVDPSTGTSPMDAKFKEAFKISPEIFKSDQAFNVFKDTFRANYLDSNSEQAAMDATTYAMRAWGTSKYFDNGMVGQPVPEKELPVAKMANAFPNQIVSNLQGLINRNEAVRTEHPTLNIPVVEWADKSQTITGNESQEDKVYKNFTIGSKPRIKIDGHETDVVLIPSAESRLGDRTNYLFGIYDQFNNLHPLQDHTNQVDGTARFMPQELATWSPIVAESQSNEAIKKDALEVLQKERERDIAQLEQSSPAWQVILGLASPSELLQHVASMDKSEGRLNEIIKSLGGKVDKTSAEDVNNAVNEADNIGISASLIPSLETKP